MNLRRIEDYFRDLARSPLRLVVMEYSVTAAPRGSSAPGRRPGVKARGRWCWRLRFRRKGRGLPLYWRENPPSWLGTENPEWPGNYLVEHWSPGWWEILSEYLDEIAALGFDGFGMDKVDSVGGFRELPAVASG